jgi:twinkle protein
MNTTYTKPKLNKYVFNLSERIRTFISTREISQSSLEALKIRQNFEWMPQTGKKEECICFDYYLNGEIVNTKYRDLEKNFKLFKGAERIFYNLDSIKDSKSCIIVEGEFDVLAYATAGVKNVISVPNGFNLKGDKINLDYLDNYGLYFDSKEIIYIAVDNDEAGRKGGKELIRRLGSDRCKVVNFEDCKDANDYLIKHGKESLSKTITNAKEIKIEGVFSAAEVEDEMIQSYLKGNARGSSTRVLAIDKAWKWRQGEVNLWTGYQNEGKSLMLNQLCLIRSFWDGVKVGVFSPENMPIEDFYNDLIEMYIGKSADPYYSSNYMTPSEFKQGYDFVKDHFYLIYPETDFTIKSIFERAKYLVRRHGIRTLIIDPYNTVDHKMNPGEREDLYISKFMSQLKRFAIEYDISIHLVAHQTTARKNPNDSNRYFKPDLNNIKGGGTFADKADNVLFVWRPNRALDFKDRNVVFGSQKIKKQKLVGTPQDIDEITFNIRENRYYFNGESPFFEIDKKRKSLIEKQ